MSPSHPLLLVIFTIILLFLSSYVLQSDSMSLPINTEPEWDLCVNGGDLYSCSGRGSCSNGACVCAGGYTGRDCSVPPGGWTYSRPATATWFCILESGGCAPGMCIGGGQFDDTSLPDGVDGICALSPTMYGSRYAYANGQGGIPRTLNGEYSTVGQGCGTCWQLVRAGVSVVVAVADRCAGYCRATAAGDCDPTSESGEQECGNCINKGEASIPQCSCLSPDSLNSTGYWCYGINGVNCDWCAANDHPHFDLDQTTFYTICGDAASSGHCSLDSFQMVDCGDFKGPWPNGYPNGTDAPASSNTGGTNGGTNTGGSGGGTPCGSVQNGGYVCDGCTLMECNAGSLVAFACPPGTVCQSGQCGYGSSCDPPLNQSSNSGYGSSTTSSSSTSSSSSSTTSEQSKIVTDSNSVKLEVCWTALLILCFVVYLL